MLTRLRASGLPSSPSRLSGSGSGSVFALRILSATVSASSVRLIRDMSDGSDFDIFLVPSRSDITRVAAPPITGSGRGKKSTPKSLLNFAAMSRVSSRCCFWSSPTGTWVVWYTSMSAAISAGYPNRPSEAFSAFFPALSLNWVMRVIQPIRATQLRIQPSCACSATCDWLKRIDFFGSRPAAMNPAHSSRVARRSASGSCRTVIACRSTMQ